MLACGWLKHRPIKRFMAVLADTKQIQNFFKTVLKLLVPHVLMLRRSKPIKILIN